jgi:hypothetical protein
MTFAGAHMPTGARRPRIAVLFSRWQTWAAAWPARRSAHGTRPRRLLRAVLPIAGQRPLRAAFRISRALLFHRGRFASGDAHSKPHPPSVQWAARHARPPAKEEAQAAPRLHHPPLCKHRPRAALPSRRARPLMALVDTPNAPSLTHGRNRDAPRPDPRREPSLLTASATCPGLCMHACHSRRAPSPA